MLKENDAVFITGGNSGIGLAAALVFARNGIDVAIYSRREGKNERARSAIENEGVRCLAFSGDVCDEESVRAAIDIAAKAFGGLRYAFVNAGAQQSVTPISELSCEEYQRLMDVNVKGAFLCLKYLIPVIARSGGGAICNNASAAGLLPSAMQALYGAAKFAVVGLTKAAALEAAPLGVRVNVVCPGATTGEMWLSFARKHPQQAADVLAKHPLGRVGLKEEVAAAVLWLCRDATFTTGHAFTVDGGRTLR